jgi:hypothetical protein
MEVIQDVGLMAEDPISVDDKCEELGRRGMRVEVSVSARP